MKRKNGQFEMKKRFIILYYINRHNIRRNNHNSVGK